MTNPDEIRRIADRRLEEAGLLFRSGFFEGAYYLAGYTVELHLKAKICERLDLYDLFEDAESSVANRASFSNLQIGRLFKVHELQKLLLLSGLSKTVGE